MRFHSARKERDLPRPYESSSSAPWRRRLQKLAGGIASVAVIATSLVVAGGTVGATPAAAANPFECVPGMVYVQSDSQVRQFSIDEDGEPGHGGTLEELDLAPNPSTNGLGISSGGRYAYTVTNSGRSKQFTTYDRKTESNNKVSFELNSSILRGAVHPTSGVYYFASSTVNGGINLYAWNDQASPQTYLQVGTLRPSESSRSFGSNGDMAFSASGQLVIVADRYIYSADIPKTLVASTDTIEAKEIHDMGAGVEGNGIAFGNLGHIFVSASNGGNRIIEVDLARGVEVNETSLGSFSPTDMASCTFPNTLTLKKDVPSGRHAATDQFALRIDSPAGYKIPQTNALTRGNADGVQHDYAGPVFVNQGDTFTLSEFAAGTADFTRYASSLSCEQLTSDGASTPVPLTGTNQIVQPYGGLGTEVVCTFANDKLAPSLELRKTSDPASGTPVAAGQRITYSVEAENTGNTVLDPVTIADDLSGVLDAAEYQDDIVTAIDGVEVADDAATITGDDLAWTGALAPGQTVAVTYSVIVNDDVAGERIANSVTASGTPPGDLDPIDPPAVTTEHPIAGFELTKIADPDSGSVVEPGQTIEYTITGTNTGATPLAPATITDDLSGVLAHAASNDDLTTEIDGTTLTEGGASIEGSTLSWEGELAPGASVTINYSVTVAADASGEVLLNTVTGSATPQAPDADDPDGPPIPGTPIVPPSATTQHPVLGSGFTVSKTADPAPGTAVEAGDTITYTVIGTNTGDTELSPATLTDDLSKVLDRASYNDDVRADRGTAKVSGSELAWEGALGAGDHVEITYSVTVDADVERALLRNTVTGSATPRIPTDPSDPESPTTPGATITPEPAETEHPVVELGFEVVKSAVPESGTAVRAGDTIEYTVTGTNTGNTALAPASIVDDLSGVLQSAELDGAPVASNGSATVSGTTLEWHGELAAGEDVTITYSVTVNADATGVLLRNTVTGAATPLIPEDPTDPESPTHPGPQILPPPAVTEHPVANPGFAVTKTADPETGSRVDPGSVITYTVTGTNTGDTVLDPVDITDDLAGVLAHAAYNGDVKATQGSAAIVGDHLTWEGALEPRASVVITYSVTVDAQAGGESLLNTVSGLATPLIPADPSDPESPTTPGDELAPPPASTEHAVNTPGFTFSKTVDPESGTAVDPGTVLTYTLTGTNTGETALPKVDISDDLSHVVDHADYNGDAVAMIADDPAAAPVLDGTTLSWSGPLEVGESVVLQYTVTAGPEAAGYVLENSAVGKATPPGGEELTPPQSNTANPVNLPGFSVSKSADPASGSIVDPGATITYTVTGTNTGETTLDPATLTDDLSGVLGLARYNDDATASIGETEAAEPTVRDGVLAWEGELQPGETVTVTYSVTVDAGAAGKVLRNTVVGSATPPGSSPIETPAASTEHPVAAAAPVIEPGDDEPAAPAPSPLADTGAAALPWVGVLALVLLLGGGALLLSRRRPTS